MQNYSPRLPVTFGLIAACVLVYVGVAALGQTFGTPLITGLINQPGVLITGALVPEFVAEGQAWRLLTSAFLHSGFVHLAFNMLALYFLGSLVEATFGRGRFFALFLLSGIAGGIAYLYFGEFNQPAVGASGAIFGILGGVFGFTIRRGTFSTRDPLLRQLLVLTALNLFLGATIPNISNIAHVGGLIGGFLFGWLMAPTVYAQKKVRAATPVAIMLALEAILLAFWFIYLV